MFGLDTPITVALIAAIPASATAWAAVRGSRSHRDKILEQNTREHAAAAASRAESAAILRELSEDVKYVRGRFDEHIADHARGSV